MAEGGENLSLHELTEWVIEASGLMDYHGREPGERGLARKENLQELVTAARQFSGELVFPLQDADQPEVSELEEFLDQAALDAGDRESGAGPAVQMMTLHSAKGLEFPTVFITGLEEGLFPHRQSRETENGLEEERRLCYVGITRAMRRLYLTHAETRRLHGVENYNRPSRFIRELPPNLVSEIRVRRMVGRSSSLLNPVRGLFAPQAERRQHRPAGGASEVWRRRGAAMRRPRRTHPGAGPFRRRRRKVADAQRSESTDLGLNPPLAGETHHES